VSSSSGTNFRHRENDADSTVSVIDNNNKRHERHLSLRSFFSDPRTIEIKAKQQQPPSFLMALDINGNPRPLNILAFGGSVMMEAQQVSDRSERTYPKLIGAPYFDHVDNFAKKETGTDYPSLCLETILTEGGETAQGLSCANRSYDLIFVEFAVNGMSWLPSLLRRLKERYPDAVIVFVRLWSVLGDAVERGTGRTVFELGKDVSIDWVWNENADIEQFHKGIKAFVSNEINEFYYELPKPEKPLDAIDKGWFTGDWQHLSGNGHALVADDIIRFLTSNENIVHRLISNEKRLGSWSWGDRCYSWLENGKIPSKPTFHYDGARLTNGNHTWLLEFSNSGGVLRFNSGFPIPVPLSLGYMTQQVPAEYPEVSVNDQNPVVLNPGGNKLKVMSETDFVSIVAIGWAEPGLNTITVKPHTLAFKQTSPLRVSGIIMRGISPLPEMSELFNLPFFGGCDGQQRGRLEIYLPPNPNGSTVLYVPGGAYVDHVIDYRSCVDYIAAGYTLAILHYRLPRDLADLKKVCSDPYDALIDLKFAMEHLKKKGASKIVIAGSSAGGHLVALYGTTCDENLCPDAMVLHSPWLEGGAQVFCSTVGGFFENVDFEDSCFPAALVDENTPPVVMFHSQGDPIVPTKTMTDFDASLKAHQVPHAYYEVPGGTHSRRPFEEVVAVSDGALSGGLGYAELVDQAIQLLDSRH